MRKLLLILSLFTTLCSAQTPMQEYYALLQQNQNGCTDPDVCNYVNEVAAAGYAIPYTQQRSIDSFIINLKASGIYAKQSALYLFVGGKAAAHAIDFKGGYDLSYLGTVGHNLSGANWGGTGGGNTGLIPSSVLSLNNLHVAVYTPTNNGAAYAADFGSYGAIGTQIIGLQLGGTGAGSARLLLGSQVITVANADTKGMYVASRLSDTLSFYKNGSILGTSTVANTGSLPTIPIYLGAANNNGTLSNSTIRAGAFISIGSGLTAAEAIQLSSLVNTLQISIGRNTY